jgi:glycerol-3-phosphate cytidylyltransferase
MVIAITFGTFDLFHIGHLKILEQSKNLADKLIVGVSSDELNKSKKNKIPTYPYEHRKEIINSLKCVHSVFKEESLDKKREYIINHSADILIMGDDWKGKFDDLKDICSVIYLPRTPCISTTETIEKIIFNNTK